MERIGHQIPAHVFEDMGKEYDFISNENTGMNYEVYGKDFTGNHIVSAEHDAVGLVTWFRMSESEVAKLYGEAEQAALED